MRQRIPTKSAASHIAIFLAILCLQACNASYVIEEGPQSLNNWTEVQLVDRFPLGRTTLADVEAQLGACPSSNFLETEPQNADGMPGTGAKWCSWTYQRGLGFKGGSVAWPSQPDRYSAYKRMSFTFHPQTRILQRFQIEALDPKTKITRTIVISEEGRWTNERPNDK